MTTKNNRRGQSGGAGEAGKLCEGFALPQANLTTSGAARQDLRLPSGRIGGCLCGDALRTVCQKSKHFHRRLRAWGVDMAILLEARERGARLVEVVDTESGETWRTEIDFIITHGLRFDFGYGLQAFLPLKDWRRGNGPEQLNSWG